MEQKDKFLYEPPVVQVIEIVTVSALLDVSGRDYYDNSIDNPFAG